MTLLASRRSFSALAVDEIAIVIFVRLLVNMVPSVLLGLIASVIAKQYLPSLTNGALGTLSFSVMGAVYGGWLILMFWNARCVIATRPPDDVHRVDTLRRWGRFAQVVAVISWLRYVIPQGVGIEKGLLWLCDMAWILSCLMFCFFCTYAVLLALSRQLTGFWVVRAALFSTASAFFPPENMGRH